MRSVEEVLEQVRAQIQRGKEIVCPYCDYSHDTSDGDVCHSVVTYWGEEHHDFSCDSCGHDFMVKEIVSREFEAAKTIDDFE